ncbi:zinc metalloprotease [Brevibacillus gelatini]|uniref:Peptidase M10 metallopeptidase domain-containing protein n=1 Tax=Brevibacillus gelatini TaxID=1655277 RepID=A0A3M8AYQ2_9BACL|nr:hypothetical protein [Brevibacillus gelatini]RNB56143.1 hypothetical protein EDM57_12990 [Brevibacillus gelatini]
MNKKSVFTLVLLGAFTLSNVAYAELRRGDAFFDTTPTANYVKDIDTYINASVADENLLGAVTEAISDYEGISGANINYDTNASASSYDLRVAAGQLGLDYAGETRVYYLDDDDTYQRHYGTEAWDRVKIYLNREYMDYYNYSSANRRKTTIHEFGHGLGLVHQTSNSIMQQGKLSLTDPTQLDRDNLSWKY